MNRNWPRWFVASIYRHMSTLGDEGFAIFYEGEERDPAISRSSERVEVRMDGPRFVEYAKNQFEVRVEVNVIITTVMDTKNLYRVATIAGIVAEHLYQNIEVLKVGNVQEPEPVEPDDLSFFTCLVPIADIRNHLEINHLGQVEPRTRVIQAMVEVHYRSEINGTD